MNNMYMAAAAAPGKGTLLLEGLCLCLSSYTLLFACAISIA